MVDQYYTQQPPQMARKQWKPISNKSVSEGNLWSGRKKFPVSSNLDEFTIYPDKVASSDAQSQEDGRTTVMIKNIPNKYSKLLMLQKLNINYKDAFDFFYLPIDFKVVRPNGRTSATWVTPSSTSSTPSSSNHFMKR
jgi:hypothetical protein